MFEEQRIPPSSSFTFFENASSSTISTVTDGKKLRS
jgi:hypothetical protein